MSDSRYDDENWTHEEFFEKMDYEGGVAGMLGWGGSGCFPPEIRAEAKAVDDALYALEVKMQELDPDHV